MKTGSGTSRQEVALDGTGESGAEQVVVEFFDHLRSTLSHLEADTQHLVRLVHYAKPQPRSLLLSQVAAQHDIRHNDRNGGDVENETAAQSSENAPPVDGHRCRGDEAQVTFLFSSRTNREIAESEATRSDATKVISASGDGSPAPRSPATCGCPDSDTLAHFVLRQKLHAVQSVMDQLRDLAGLRESTDRVTITSLVEYISALTECNGVLLQTVKQAL